ncbi:PhzF family phenazine biosynthesis protein [Nitratireductor sp. StC3]|uniref:PhzF family phenazine biosynthesis protein n=1 Tax=Nitratireductor sp. StC3 TaxID=2126741 RepID=UPI000D0D0EC4|nr:PhzF family phenazine biosynthesis protein [Nitratireductor sp. StC3]PSM17846.1 phenazine biosynthesis protein PhzF [Nitratireductor sp. StC3]
MAARRYEIYDVFTDRALAGNPLAIVRDSDGLTGEAMQAIAAEFNLSETVFVGPPENPAHTASLRIFTPKTELPFAGHPTVGSAIALYEGKAPAAPDGTALIVLEEKIGPVRCAVSATPGRASFAEFDLPRLPVPAALSAEPELIAAALSLDADEIGFENHRASAWSAGVPYVCVPVAGLEAAASARLDPRLWLDIAPPSGNLIPGAYVYCRETVGEDCAFHARMFAPHDGIVEDPATGSAAAAFAGALVAFDAPVDGPGHHWIEQGVEMGRPSRIRLEVETAGGALTAARIGGHAVRVADGTLFV